MDSDTETLEVLRALLRNQNTQLERQREALELQRRQFEMYQARYGRAEQLLERAEKMQESGAWLMGVARKSFIVILPIIIVLIAYLTWPIFR